MRRVAPPVLRLFIALIAILVAPRHVVAQPAPRDQASTGWRPTFAGRVVRTFDFEQDGKNPDAVPRYWTRLYDRATNDTPDYPAWNKGGLLVWTPTSGLPRPPSGVSCVRLPTAGGGTRLVLDPGVVPIFQSADYFVAARVRTQGLNHARARVTARLLSADSVPLQGTEQSSEPILAESEFVDVYVELRGNQPGAAFVQIQLELLQPAQLVPQTSPNRHTLPQDYRGEAYFDDVSVVQLPRLELESNVESNISWDQTPPGVRVRVRDLTGESLRVTLAAVDARGITVDQAERELRPGQRSVDWIPSLPEPGWFRVVLDVWNNDARVGADYVDLAWLPYRIAAEALRPDWIARFGLVVDDASMPGLRATRRASQVLGISSVTLPVWSSKTVTSPLDETNRVIRATIDELMSQGKRVTIALPTLPNALPAHEPMTVMEYLATERAKWMPFLENYLDVFGQRAAGWQIGQSAEADVHAERLASDLRLVAHAYLPSVVKPHLVVPVEPRVIEIADARDAGVLSVRVGHELIPDAAADLASAMEQLSTRPEAAALETSSIGRVLPIESAAALVRRGVSLLAHSTKFRLDLVQPWDVPSRRTPVAMPRPELVAFAAMAQEMGARTYIGEYPAPEGVRCFIFGPRADRAGDPGLLVAWNQTAPVESSYVEGYFGNFPVAVRDLFGNDRTSTLTRAESGLVSRISLTPEPMYIDGIDIPLALFLASVRVDPELIPATNDLHDHAIVLSNPWSVQLSGKISVVEPGRGPDVDRTLEWRISPRVHEFSVAPGREIRLPFTVSFGPSVETGDHQFVLQIDAAASEQLPSMKIVRPVTIGLESLSLSAAARVQGENVIIEATLSRLSGESEGYSLIAHAPGSPRLTASVPNLAAGESVVRRFVVQNAAKRLRGQRVIVVVNGREGGARLNAGATVE